MTVLVRAAMLRNYLELARQLGINAQVELSKVNLTEAMLTNPDQPIPASAALQLLENTAELSSCQSLGARMAESRQLSDFGIMSLLLMHQPNLHHVLQIAMRYRHLLNRALAMYVEKVGDLVMIRTEVVSDGQAQWRQGNELAVGVVARMCASLLGQHWRPVSVSFTHEAPTDQSVHRRLFGCAVEFEARYNGIAVRASCLDMSNPTANSAMASQTQRFVDALQTETDQSIVQEVREAIYLLLPMGRATIEQIALALGMNVRTLQRHLQKQDVFFVDLVNAVRRGLVRCYMDNPNYSIARIGSLLGYSTSSSFTRWFISQYGAPPLAWRSAHRKSYRQETKACNITGMYVPNDGVKYIAPRKATEWPSESLSGAGGRQAVSHSG